MIKLENDEIILKVVRKHWFAVFQELFMIFVIALLPIAFFVLFRRIFFYDLAIQDLYALMYLYFIFIILIWILTFVIWTNYYLDMWLITNKRLVDVNQIGFFTREISSLRFDRIQDVKVEIFGFISTLLKIGNIHVQTAASRKEFIIRQAANPEQVKQCIMDAQNALDEKAHTVKIHEEVPISPITEV
jgi:hypothetical protein